MRRFVWVVLGVTGILAIVLISLPTVPVSVETQAEGSGGEGVLVSEDASRLFAGAEREALPVDSSLAGYPLAEPHVRAFAGTDSEYLPVDSSIAGYPVSEAHARLFAGS